jgi:hypothetical protein
MFSTGGVVLTSQLAYVSPDENRLIKQEKSWMLRHGAAVLVSQLG